MGIDINLYVVGKVTDDELAEARNYLAERELEYDLSRDDWAEDQISLYTLGRYYGPGYERGNWPSIYAHIMGMRGAFPNCVVHYGGDSDTDVAPATDEVLAKIWEHWLSPHWRDYFVRR